jgi:hypothetical protein
MEGEWIIFSQAPDPFMGRFLLPNSKIFFPATMAWVNTGSNGTRPSRVMLCCSGQALDGLGHLGIEIILVDTDHARHPEMGGKFNHPLHIVEPETVGSTTITRAVAPPMAAITGQPMPGGPSVRIMSHCRSSANCRASLRTRLTSLPEFSSAIPRRAWTMGPKRVSEMYHSPQRCTGKSMAATGQKSTQTPQPSHRMRST